jgi:hypothetical protein
MSHQRLDPPDYRGAAFDLGFTAGIVGLVSSRAVAIWLTVIGFVMIIASRKLEDL